MSASAYLKPLQCSWKGFLSHLKIRKKDEVGIRSSLLGPGEFTYHKDLILWARRRLGPLSFYVTKYGFLIWTNGSCSFLATLTSITYFYNDRVSQVTCALLLAEQLLFAADLLYYPSLERYSCV